MIWNEQGHQPRLTVNSLKAGSIPYHVIPVPGTVRDTQATFKQTYSEMRNCEKVKAKVLELDPSSNSGFTT